MSETGEHTINDLGAGDVAMIGICSDHNSSFLRGPAAAPEAIRRALHCGSASLFAESGVNIFAAARLKDLGDHSIGDNLTDYLQITDRIKAILLAGAKPLILGGDHAITFPVVKAMAEVVGQFDILHFDAHPDLYQEYAGNPYSHACPFARIMEAGLAGRLVQVGLRALNPHQREQARRFSVEQHEMRNFKPNKFQPQFKQPVYVSFDIDALDPAFAPGVSHLEPGGLDVRSVLNIIQNLQVPLVGADIVEYNPTRDTNAMTAMVAAKLVKELAAKLLL